MALAVRGGGRLPLGACAAFACARLQAVTVDFFSSRDDLPEVVGLWAEVIRCACAGLWACGPVR